MPAFEGMSDDEIRRALGEGEKPAHPAPPPPDGTAALVLLGTLVPNDIRGLYSAASNAVLLLAEGRCQTMEGRRAVAQSVLDTCRTAALLEVYTLAQRLRGGS